MKITLPKKISIRAITTLLLIVVVLFELYLAYFFLYNKLSPQPEIVMSNTGIVRINRASLSEVTQFLEGLNNYQPGEPALANPNPFKYSP